MDILVPLATLDILDTGEFGHVVTLLTVVNFETLEQFFSNDTFDTFVHLG